MQASKFRETANGKFEIVQTVKTPLGARIMDVDSSTHTIYLPTAEFDASSSGGRPSPKPGTLVMVEVGRHVAP